MVGVGRFGLYNVYRTTKERGEFTSGRVDRSEGEGGSRMESRSGFLTRYGHDKVVAPRPHNERSIVLEGGSADEVN